MINENCSLLLVDDESFPRNLLSERIKKIPKVTVAAALSSAEEAKEFILRHVVDIVITDIKMPGMDGLALAEFIREFAPNCLVIIVSGYNDFEYARKGIQLGVHDYLLKPIQFAQVVEVIQKCCQKVFQNRKKYFLETETKFSKLEVLMNKATLCDGDTILKNTELETILKHGAKIVRIQRQNICDPDDVNVQIGYRNLIKDALPGAVVLCLLQSKHIYEYLVVYKTDRYRSEGAVREYFRRILTETVCFNVCCELNSAQELVEYLKSQSMDGKKQLIKVACDFMQEHLNEGITREMVAKRVYLSPSYFGSLFKQTMGMGYNDYLTELRISKAKQLLKENIPVHHVATSVGYRDGKYFSELFFQRTGYLPSEYRQAFLRGRLLQDNEYEVT